jgi:molybdenum cofactor biosynthesis protein A
MDSPRRSLPLVAQAAPVRLDEASAAQLGLVQRGPARAQGLVDRFGRGHRTLRISVTERCNLRCQYCMPEHGVPLHARGELLTYEEIEQVAALFVKLGIRRIRLTGGEPLVRKDLTTLATKLGALKRMNEGSGAKLDELLMTTNGLLLEPLLPGLLAAGLDGVNLSLDTLRAATFEQLTRRSGLEETLSAVRAAARSPGLLVKVNAVAMRGVNDAELGDLAAHLAGELGVELRYIEYMPFDGNHWSDSALFPAAEIRARLAERYQLEPLGLDQGGVGTAQIYQLRERDAGTLLRGRVGIISSMSEPFCATCSRLRLTADGQLRWCLLDEGELDLRGPLRAGATEGDLIGLIEEALNRKAAGHAPAQALLASQARGGARSMIRIGG